MKAKKEHPAETAIKVKKGEVKLTDFGPGRRKLVEQLSKQEEADLKRMSQTSTQGLQSHRAGMRERIRKVHS